MHYNDCLAINNILCIYLASSFTVPVSSKPGNLNIRLFSQKIFAKSLLAVDATLNNKITTINTFSKTNWQLDKETNHIVGRRRQFQVVSHRAWSDVRAIIGRRSSSLAVGSDVYQRRKNTRYEPDARTKSDSAVRSSSTAGLLSRSPPR